MAQVGGIPNFAAYRTVGEAATFLGVSTATLRNWDRSGKLKPRRHPHNGYRIYLHDDLEELLRSTDLSSLTDESFAPLVNWSDMGESEHFVQFYENDEYLVESVSGFVGAALSDGNGSIVIATPTHQTAINRKLTATGIDVSEVAAAGRYVMFDAAETLAKFMVGGVPDPARFEEVVGSVVSRLAESGCRIHAFGEMVALLWADGRREAAIRLEELWNDLGKRHRFALFCAYPLGGFGEAGDAGPLSSVCTCHSRVIPSETYAAIDDPYERLRAIALLQQKAQSLEAEIAHREEVQKALAKRERELADFFENAIEGLHKVGRDGRILWANKAECELLGYSPDEFIGRPIADFHADADVIADMLSKLQRGESLVNYPARLRCKDGAIKHVLVNSNACFEAGEFAYTRCFTRDVTREREANRLLREADFRKDEFLAMLAHELRNPLAPIKNSLQLLGADTAEPAFAGEARDIIERQVDQMTRLVDDLLDISRITRGKIELRKEPLDLHAILESAIETSRPLIESARHELIVDLPSGPLPVEADATRMAQIFSNLLNNSAKYTEPGGQICLAAEIVGKEVIVRVRDNGIGISCEGLASVFDMFRQADRSLERSQGGLGIGLAIVRRLVELHGGAINAQSEGLGKGSEFQVRLPLAKSRARKIPIPQEPPRGKAICSRRILVVDDNSDSSLTLSRLLELSGHVVRTAQDGMEAISAVTNFRPEVILMDVGMPKLNGYDATRQIRQMPGGDAISIVALTGWGQPNDLHRSSEAGCSAHMVKPVDFAALERLLAECSN